MKWLIWSHRKRQWWRADRGGYTSRVDEAGRYDIAEVADITVSCLPGQNVAVDQVLAGQFSDLTAEEIVAKIDEFRNY